MNIGLERIQAEIESVYEEIVSLRRDLHRHPEPSEQEARTAEVVAKALAQRDIAVSKGVTGHGVIGLVSGQNGERAIGIRADMDALPIQEETGLPFASEKAGVMHACGHDIHTAILVGTGMVLQRLKEHLPCSVKLLFQPAEETVGGAERMIEAGCLDNPKVPWVIALHVDPALPVGDIGFIDGAANAASSEFTVRVQGTSGHGAHPPSGADALLAASNMVVSLQSIATKRVEATEPTLLTVGKFSSGTSGNIIADQAQLTGIIRTMDMDAREFLKEELRRVCLGVAAAHGVRCELAFTNGYPLLRNDPALCNIMAHTAKEVLGASHVHCFAKGSMGAEDFSYFCQSAQGFYFNLGVAKAQSAGVGAQAKGNSHQVSPDRCEDSTCYPLHSSHFAPDEGCIKTGILMEVAGALAIMEGRQRLRNT